MEARFAIAARHSRMVRILRVAVPAAVILSLAAIVMVSIFNPFRMLLPKLPNGTLTADRLRITGGGEVVRFEGNVVMNLDNPPAADTPGPSASAPEAPEPIAAHTGKTRSSSNKSANPK